MQEDEIKYEFTRGYLVAVSNMVGSHGSSTAAWDVFCALGVKPADVGNYIDTEYDLDNFADLFKDFAPDAE